MKWGRLFIGKHVELMRPVYEVDEQLMRRIAEAKQRLDERQIEPVAILRIKRAGSGCANGQMSATAAPAAG